MLVTVWRHGEAGSAPRDEDRALTGRGDRTVRQAAEAFRAWLSDASLTSVSGCRYSPLVRTTQTAHILGATLGVEPAVCRGLALSADIHQPKTFLDEEEPHLLMVSHQPFVSQLIWYWLDDDRVEPLLPGGWATLDVTVPSRGGAALVAARESIFDL